MEKHTKSINEELEVEKIRAEISKMMAETTKINKESVYYPLVVGSGVTLAIVAVVKIFLV
ncbi:MAG: hypothetical protein ACWIPH_07775 [Ostreibacterium sp.]